MTQLKNALLYAKEGWRVLPVFEIGEDGQCTCNKGAECSRPGKHPRVPHGVKNATTNRKHITEWWQTWPNANIGVATGSVSGILVIDGDRRNGGAKTLKELSKELGPLSKTVTAKTGGSGRHFVFRCPEFGVKTDTAGLLLGAGLDVLSDGGYFIAPQSNHRSGEKYRWKDGHGPRDLELAELPKPWLDQLRGEHKRPVSIDNGAVFQGGRNEHLTRVAGTLRRSGMAEQGILLALLAENSRCCSPPLPDEEVERIAGSIANYPCPFRKIHPGWIRIVRQNHCIVDIDVCNPARTRNVRR